MKSLMSVILLTTLFVVQVPCPPVVYPPIPAGVDPNRVTFDHDGSDPNRPAAARYLLRPTIYNTLGKTVEVTGWVCDNDGDPMQIVSEKGSITLNPEDKTWTLRYKPTSVGDEYFRVTVSDIRQTPDSMSTSGTLRVVTVVPNRPPTVGCGSRP